MGAWGKAPANASFSREYSLYRLVTKAQFQLGTKFTKRDSVLIAQIWLTIFLHCIETLLLSDNTTLSCLSCLSTLSCLSCLSTLSCLSCLSCLSYLTLWATTELKENLRVNQNKRSKRFIFLSWKSTITQLKCLFSATAVPQYLSYSNGRGIRWSNKYCNGWVRIQAESDIYIIMICTDYFWKQRWKLITRPGSADYYVEGGKIINPLLRETWQVPLTNAI